MCNLAYWGPTGGPAAPKMNNKKGDIDTNDEDLNLGNAQASSGSQIVQNGYNHISTGS